MDKSREGPNQQESQGKGTCQTSLTKNVAPTTETFYSNKAEFEICAPPDSRNFGLTKKVSRKHNEIFSPVKFSKPTETDSTFVYVSAPMVAEGEKGLILAPWSTSYSDRTIIGSGDSYVIRTTGMFCKTKGGNETKISNTRVEIIGFEYLYKPTDQNSTALKPEEYVTGNAIVSNGKIYAWKVKLRDYKNLFEELTKEHGDISLKKTRTAEIDDYLSDIYSNALNANLPKIISVEWSGWYEIAGRPAMYYIGKKDPTAGFADVKDEDRLTVFNNGVRYLQIGRYQKNICILFLVMHAAFTRFWFVKAGINWNMVLIVQGETNSGKTSLLEVSSNILSSDRTIGAIKLTDSSPAGMRRTFNTVYRDTFCFLDDHSDSDSQSSRNAYDLVEKALRAIGDNSGRLKAGPGQTVIREKAECVLAVTAEKGFVLSASSNTRYITVFFSRKKDTSNDNAEHAGSIDFNALLTYQQNPEILHKYFTLFIEFLTVNGYQLSETFKKNSPIYRQYYGQFFKIGRFTDAAVRLHLQSLVICEFATYCGCSEIDTEKLKDLLLSSIVDTVKAQEALLKESVPSQVFLQALADCVDLAKELAPDEIAYLQNPGYFIGFKSPKDGTIWLNKELINARVLSYIRSEGIFFRTSERDIPKVLCDDGYARAVTSMKNGRTHITCIHRSKKGTSSQRKGMYVLYADKIKEFFEMEETEAW